MVTRRLQQPVAEQLRFHAHLPACQGLLGYSKVPDSLKAASDLISISGHEIGGA